MDNLRGLLGIRKIDVVSKGMKVFSSGSAMWRGIGLLRESLFRRMCWLAVEAMD